MSDTSLEDCLQYRVGRIQLCETLPRLLDRLVLDPGRGLVQGNDRLKTDQHTPHLTTDSDYIAFF